MKTNVKMAAAAPINTSLARMAGRTARVMAHHHGQANATISLSVCVTTCVSRAMQVQSATPTLLNAALTTGAL